MNSDLGTLIDLLLLGMLVATAVGIVLVRQLFAVAMLSSLYSLLMACMFVLLDAVDVAFTEASVGAGISTVLTLGALALTRQSESKTRLRRHLLAFATCATLGGILIWSSLEMPGVGEAHTPVQTHPVTDHYLHTSADEIGLPNVVTSVLASYRGYDTFGEATVIFTAGLGVFVLLWGRRRPTRVS